MEETPWKITFRSCPVRLGASFTCTCRRSLEIAKEYQFPEARQVPSANVSIRNASSSTNFVVPHLLSVSGMVTLNNDQALPKGFPSRLSTLTVCSPPAADSDNSVDRTSYSSFRECEPSQPGKNKSAHITLATIVETETNNANKMAKNAMIVSVNHVKMRRNQKTIQRQKHEDKSGIHRHSDSNAVDFV